VDTNNQLIYDWDRETTSTEIEGTETIVIIGEEGFQICEPGANVQPGNFRETGWKIFV
jgi:hypothetical protein